MHLASVRDTFERYVCEVYLLSRLEAFTAANTRVFRVSPAMGMARCWMYEESLKTQHYTLGHCTVHPNKTYDCDKYFYLKAKRSI